MSSALRKVTRHDLLTLQAVQALEDERVPATVDTLVEILHMSRVWGTATAQDVHDALWTLLARKYVRLAGRPTGRTVRLTTAGALVARNLTVDVP